MGTKLRVLIIVVIVALGLSGAVAVGQAQESTDSSVIGPYTEIALPPEDLPALNENLAFHPVIDQYESGATLQVMYVLEDPREVPLARYAYYAEDEGVIAPNDLPSMIDRPEYTQEMEEILSQNPKTINVYVRAMAPADQSVPDPLFGDLKRLDSEGNGFIRPYNPNRPALVVDFPGSGKPFICAVPEYINNQEPYQLPPDINGGNAVGSDGLYDPSAFAPPLPWYDNQGTMLAPGEIREGWISCMAPNMPVENILIQALYSYTPEPLSTPTPGPSPTPYDDSDCEIVDSFDDPVCSTGVCCQLSANATLEAMIDSTSTAWASEDDGEVNWEEYEPSMEVGLAPAWSYARTASIPEDGIRLEDTSMVFINDVGDQKIATGTALFRTANIVQIERYEFNDFLFVAEISVEPNGLSEEDLQGYALYRIYADVGVFELANASTVILEIAEVQNKESSTYETFLSANFQYQELLGFPDSSGGKLPFDDMFRHDPASPFTGYVFGNLEPERRFSPLSSHDSEWNELISTTLWFNIDSTTPGLSEIDDTRVKDLTRYAAKGINIHNTNLVSSTSMCDVIECLGVRDPKDDNNEVRTVPIMCPGEWANGFMIDGLSIEDIDYIGEPNGKVSIRSFMQNRAPPPKTWVFRGRILGGLSPWWSNLASYRNIDLISRLNGEYLDTDTGILPLYYKSADSYQLPVNNQSYTMGWANGLVQENLFIFSVVEEQDSQRNNNVVLFLEEGPVWDTSCTRPSIQELISPDAYSPPLTGSSFEIFDQYHSIIELLPGFRFPVSEARLSTGLSVGEQGAPINDQVFRPVEVMVIPGRNNTPIRYVPGEEKYYPYKENETDNNILYFNNVGAQLIPTNSSLVLIKIEKVSPSGPIDCRTEPGDIHISYPGYYSIATETRNYKAFSTPLSKWVCSIGLEDFTDRWFVFRFPSLDIDINQIVLSIKGEDNWILWGLGDSE